MGPEGVTKSQNNYERGGGLYHHCQQNQFSISTRVKVFNMSYILVNSRVSWNNHFNNIEQQDKVALISKPVASF